MMSKMDFGPGTGSSRRAVTRPATASQGDARSCQLAAAGKDISAAIAAAASALRICTRADFLAFARFAISIVAPRIDPASEIGARRHADDVVSGIDEVNFPGDGGRQIAQQIERSIADVIQLNILLERTVRPVPAKHDAGLADD